MKRSRFSEEQIIDASKQLENDRGIPKPVREIWITETTFGGRVGNSATWGSRTRAGWRISRGENRKLKRRVADQALDIAALKDIVSRKP